MIVLDTNVVSELMRDPPAGQVLRWLDRHVAGELAVTSVTLFELQYGVTMLPPGQRKARLLRAFEDVVTRRLGSRVLPFDASAAMAAAAIAADQHRSGRSAGAADQQIAGTALRHGAQLATRNVRHFIGCGLIVTDPWAG